MRKLRYLLKRAVFKLSPRAAERLFVMGPLAEIAPAWRHPDLNSRAGDLAREALVGRDARAV